MDDLISRQAILDMLEDINNHIIDGYGYKHDWCVEWVKGLPSIDAGQYTDDEIQRMQDIEQAQIQKAYDLGYAEGKADAEPQWIPVEEASPERENESIMRHYYLTTNAYGAVSITAYEFDGRTWGVHGWNSDIRIVAWMPLPAPWKGEGE